MNPISIFASLGKITSALGAAAHYGPMVISFILNAINAAEQTGASGADKLTSVLNLAGTFASQLLPAEATAIQDFEQTVEEFVGVVVNLYNQAGVFIKKGA